MKKLLSLVLIAIICFTPIYNVCAQSNYSVIREPVYNMADSFYSNVTKVSAGSMWGLCDTNGYPLTNYSWEAIGEIRDELIPAKQGDLWGYISYEGETKIPYSFKKADNFSGDFARVLTEDGKYAYINRSGEVAFFPPFEYSFTPSEGLICGVSGGKYGYADLSGNIVIETKFDMGFDFHEGYASVKFGEQWGYITKTGAYLVSPLYDYASDFCGGFAVCKNSTGYGIIDSSGIRVSPFTFDYIGECDEQGRFPAKSGQNCGYINSRGEWLIELDYDFCYTFTEGVARVFKDNLWGYINEQGKELVAPQFFDCGEYRNDRAFYSTDGLTYGFLTLDKEGTSSFVQEIVTPSNPAQSENADETLPITDETVGTYEEIIDLADINSIPTFPSEDKCVSLRIGSPYALKNQVAKKLVAPPALIDDITMVPLRDLVEFMGGTIKWNDDAQRINIEFKKNKISLTIGSKICYVNAMPSYLNSAPRLIDGVTMIPVRAVTTGLGCKVEWIPETQNICIKY